jgi:hypothetical protein
MMSKGCVNCQKLSYSLVGHGFCIIDAGLDTVTTTMRLEEVNDDDLIAASSVAAISGVYAIVMTVLVIMVSTLLCCELISSFVIHT